MCNNRQDCAFLSFVGKDFSQPHNSTIKSWEDMMYQSWHIDKLMHRQTTQQVLTNRLHLKALIDVIRWLTFQAYTFRDHDESVTSKN